LLHTLVEVALLGQDYFAIEALIETLQLLTPQSYFILNQHNFEHGGGQVTAVCPELLKGGVEDVVEENGWMQGRVV
jgi:hypothetical protein